jgi:hypothetical protein
MDRFTLAVVGGVLALVLAALGAAVVVRGSSAPPDLSTPSGTVLAYSLAERQGDPQTAWDLLDPSVQARADHTHFLATASDSFGDAPYLTTEDERIDATGASVVLVRTYSNRGGVFGGGDNSYSSRSTIRLVRSSSDSGWRITAPPDPYTLGLSEDKHP